MNGDFARVSFDPTAHYRRVLLQQGRMLLEADFNEQSAIHDHYMRCLVADLKGRWWRVRHGFALVAIEDSDFSIGYGHGYVEGMLCENDPLPGSAGATCRFSDQPFVVAGTTAAAALPELPFLIYIECWERQVGALEVPGLREIALGGPDTALRTQTVWQIRLQTSDGMKNAIRQVEAALQVREKQGKADPGDTGKADKTKGTKTEPDLTKLDTAFEALTPQPAAKQAKEPAAKPASPSLDPAIGNDLLDALEAAVPLMRAMAKSDAVNDDPCTIAVDSQYRGRENQLYRIEVHDGGTAQTATLKWSRENGSVQFGIHTIGLDKATGAVQIGLANTGRDARTGLAQGDWVELCGAAVELSGSPGPLGRVTGFGPAPDTVSLSLPKTAQVNLNPNFYTILRRWDQSGAVTPNGVLPVVESAEKWLPLERGIQVQFVPGGVYRTGDYWLVPARVASGDVDWPMTAGANSERMALPSSGIKRYRAALGIARKAGSALKMEAFSYPE
jgi:hypothetical protein